MKRNWSKKQMVGGDRKGSQPRSASYNLSMFARGGRVADNQKPQEDESEVRISSIHAQWPGGQQAGPIRIMSPPLPSTMIQKATSPTSGLRFNANQRQQPIHVSSSTDSLEEGVRQQSSNIPHNSKRKTNMVSGLPSQPANSVQGFKTGSNQPQIYTINTSQSGRITTVGHQKQQALLLESSAVSGRNLTSQISQSQSESGAYRLNCSNQKSQGTNSALYARIYQQLSTNPTQPSQLNRASSGQQELQRSVNQVKIPLNLQAQYQHDALQGPNAPAGHESDVAVSPSPDRKIQMQYKAINMPHDTSKLRGMAVRKNLINAKEKAQTPVVEKQSTKGGRRMDNRRTFDMSSQRIEEFHEDELTNMAVQFEKKLLPTVSPQSKFKMLKQNYRYNQSTADWQHEGRAVFNFNADDSESNPKEQQQLRGLSFSASVGGQHFKKPKDQLKITPQHISDNPRSRDDKNSILNLQESNEKQKQNQQTIVKQLKNMFSDLLEGKKPENKNDGGDSSHEEEENEAKVYMSDTDEDGSQISPIQTFKVNQNRKQQIMATHEDQFSPDSDQVIDLAAQTTHDRHSIHQSIQGFQSPEKTNKLIASRDSAIGVAKQPHNGIFSDIFNIKYINSGTKKQESQKSDSIGAVISRNDKQDDEQFKTLSPDFKNEPQSAVAKSISTFFITKQNESQPLQLASGDSNYQTFNIKLTKAGPPADDGDEIHQGHGQSQSEFIGNQSEPADFMMAKSHQIDRKKEELPKSQNVFQRIQNFFNKEQEKETKLEAGSEDIDENNRDDVLSQGHNTKDRISTLNINAKRNTGSRKRDTSQPPNTSRQASPLIAERTAKETRVEAYSLLVNPQAPDNQNQESILITLSDLSMPPLKIKVFRNYVRRIKHFEFTSDRSRIVIIWKVVRRDIIQSNYETKQLEDKLTILEQNIKWLTKMKQKKDASSEQQLKLMISDQKIMKQLLQECRQPKEIREIETCIESIKDVKDEPEENQQIFNLKTQEEIKEVFQDGFTVHDGKTLRKLIDFSKKGLKEQNMKASTRNNSDFSIHYVSLHDDLPYFMAIVFNDNKSRCELYNLECQHFQLPKLKRTNSMQYLDDLQVQDQIFLRGPQKCEFYSQTVGKRNSRYRKNTETRSSLLKQMQTFMKNESSTSASNVDFDYITSLTSRPATKSKQNDLQQDFSIFHQSYDSSVLSSGVRRDDFYQFESQDNLQLMQAIKQKQSMMAVRPFLYLQEEGEILKVKFIGKKWIIVGAKKEKSAKQPQGHITVWERQNQKPKLKVFMTQVCLDGRFWTKQSVSGLESLQIAFIEVPKEDTGTDEHKKELYILRIYDFQQERFTHKIEVNWQIGNVIFTNYEQRLIVQSSDGQYIFVYSLVKKCDQSIPIQKFKQKQSLDQKEVVPIQLIELNFDDVIKRQSSTPSKQFFRINVQLLLSQNNNTNQIQIFLVLPDVLILKQEAEEQKRLLNQILKDGQTQTTIGQWLRTNLDHYIPDFIMYGPSMQVNLNQLLGGDNSLLLIKEELLTQKRPKIDEKHEILQGVIEKCESHSFFTCKSDRQKLIEKVENLVPPKIRKAHNTAKFCIYSQSNNDPSKVLSIVTENGRFIQLNIPLEDILKYQYLTQLKEMQANFEYSKKMDPENEDLKKMELNLRLHPVSGYSTHLPTSFSYFSNVIKPEAYVRHQKCLEELQRKPSEGINANVKKLIGNGCIQLGDNCKRMDSKWVISNSAQ